MEVEQMMSRLLAQIRTNREQMEANQERMDANLREA
jgi:hypothetical protein